LVLQNRPLTIREIAEYVGISFGSCQTILTKKKLNMHRVAAKFVPRVLTEDQKANRVNISQELLDRVSVDENFLKTIVTGDETFSLFPKLKSTLKGHRFDTFDEIQKNSSFRNKRYRKRSKFGRNLGSGVLLAKKTALKETNLNKLYLST
jgi:hypothetical protein